MGSQASTRGLVICQNKIITTHYHRAHRWGRSRAIPPAARYEFRIEFVRKRGGQIDFEYCWDLFPRNVYDYVETHRRENGANGSRQLWFQTAYVSKTGDMREQPWVGKQPKEFVLSLRSERERRL